eukprot:3249763-Amphidinium_carterae.1
MKLCGLEATVIAPSKGMELHFRLYREYFIAEVVAFDHNIRSKSKKVEGGLLAAAACGAMPSAMG